MLRRIRVTADGKLYDVVVQIPDVTAAAPAGPAEVVCPLSGQVTAISIEVGQLVKEGAGLITIEAMQVQTFAFAPRAGKVLEIKVAVGAEVNEGQLLALLE
ncbi:MAG TPA: biotin/lipoyl-containing protein [Dongiaceae bacterium]|jgi:biotin carboxyl carrier protein|nr:biotin/lipoyl-containing protein [Dongiaceae bacterium]